MRLLYVCAAFLSVAAGALVVASLFIADRAPQGTEMLGVHLTVGAVFLGLGALLAGIQRHVAAVAALAHGRDGEVPAHASDGDTTRKLAPHVDRLVAYLVAAGAFSCLLLGAMAYGILERIGQGFAVFG